MSAGQALGAGELLPCPNPWCEGPEREGDFSPAVSQQLFGNWRVCCTSCCLDGPVAQDRDGAIAAWNKRTPTPDSEHAGGSGAVAWRRMNPQGTASTGVTDTKFNRDLWIKEGATVQPLYTHTPQPAGGWQQEQAEAEIANKVRDYDAYDDTHNLDTKGNANNIAKAILASLVQPNPEVGAVEVVAQRMAESVELVWEKLSEKPDIVTGHGMPEGCKQYWRDLAALAQPSGERPEKSS